MTERLGMHKRKRGRQLGETRTHTEGRQVRVKMEAEQLALLKAAQQK